MKPKHHRRKSGFRHERPLAEFGTFLWTGGGGGEGGALGKGVHRSLKVLCLQPLRERRHS